MATKPSAKNPNTTRFLILGAVVVVGGALVAWRWSVAARGPEVDAAAAAQEQAIQEQIEREGLTALPEPGSEEIEEPVKTKAARSVPGSEPAEDEGGG